MKPLFRIAMSLVCLTLLLWGGVAVPAETSPVPESPEYLMKVVRDAPWPLPASLAEAEGEWVVPGGTMVAEGVAVPESPEYLMVIVRETPWPLPASLAEAEGEWVVPGGTMVAGVIPPEIGSYEYSLAMETGSLPSACAGETCPAEPFTIVEAGGSTYRLEVDLGGN